MNADLTLELENRMVSILEPAWFSKFAITKCSVYRRYDVKQDFFRILDESKGEAGRLAVGCFFLLLTAVCNMFVPFFAGRMTDSISLTLQGRTADAKRGGSPHGVDGERGRVRERADATRRAVGSARRALAPGFGLPAR